MATDRVLGRGRARRWRHDDILDEVLIDAAALDEDAFAGVLAALREGERLQARLQATGRRHRPAAGPVEPRGRGRPTLLQSLN
jgi:hypothetical protein